MTSKPIILCPSARLARSIQNDIAQQYIQSEKSQWLSPKVQTLSQWLNLVIEEGLLAGLIVAQSAPYALSAFNEQSLWQEVITQSLKKHALGELFDAAGMAKVAVEANRYVVAWNLHVPREHQAEESRQFMLWQQAFRARCAELNVLESVRYFDWQLSQLAQLGDGLPSCIAFAGFDQTAPQEQRLRDVLIELGVTVADYATTASELAQTTQLCLENEEAECRAAVAWAEAYLNAFPQANIAIVTPRLSEVRNRLADLLDDVFYPESTRPVLAALPRRYNFSLGTALTQQPVIQAALNLLRLVTSHQLAYMDVSAMLLSPFWSASNEEADARAMLDVRMREKLPMQFTLSRFITFLQAQHDEGLNVAQLLHDLKTAVAAIPDNTAQASRWGSLLDNLLNHLRWPGARNIASLEYQAMNAWQKALQQLAQLDVLGKRLSAGQAVAYLQQICTEQVFQPETEKTPVIQILGIMEGLSRPVDAIWCMHMNDHIWPLPARPNPLLPAFVQRAAAVPNADNSVQAAFAATIHHRLLHSASTIIFSSSRMEGESELRVSPLMKGIPVIGSVLPLAETLAEQLTHAQRELEHVDDHIAPAVREGEHVSGGTGLLKAQAVCPAWAFYQYRLGAKALKAPTAGLDSMARGSLVHGVLEHFWRKRHYADLRDMSSDDLAKSLAQAVQHAIQAFVAENDVVSDAVLALEQERLTKLVGDWLQFEKNNGVSFRIVACEAEKKVYIRGIEVTLKIDRIHALAEGGLVFVDYKTGQVPKTSSWGEDRITEPQLPIYAIFYPQEEDARVSGVYFGMVKTAEHAFSGVDEDIFSAESAKRKPAFIQEFSDWASLLAHWKSSIEAIAEELKSGASAVRFSNESELMYCEVLPLLRLPERKLQFERFQGDAE
ncbi:MAG: DNA helicase [Betaproteobacteria bacterium HGW-Betaproteobacteria-22]|nr:MAG: DNA helicase [Betaproteobacteria bacterium HGW-Betaproteobacteria-22]